MTGPAPEIVIAATFTTAPLEQPLSFWFRELNLAYQVRMVGYQQLFQVLLDPMSAFAQNRRGANVALFRFEDLASEQDDSRWKAHACELADALTAAAAQFSVPLIVCLCPESARFLETEERQRSVATLRQRFTAGFQNRPNLYIVCPNHLIATYEVTEVDDPLAERAGHVPYRNEFYIALATGLARTIASLERKPVKAIAVDCDNTLWSGVCGEDGPAAVQVDGGRRALQHFLLERKRAGILLALVSKNNEADVRETLAAHPDMPLQWADLSAHRINWDQKSENLVSVAAELGLGLDSFVLLDDDARECAEVQRNCPEVITLQVPETSAVLAHFLRHVWPLDQVKATTAEDRRRSELYAEQSERNSLLRRAASLDEFLATLRLEIVFAPVTPETLPRVAQLTQRTNQMNTTLARFTEAELRSALAAGMHAFTTVVRDRFGDYGLVGVTLMRERGEELIVTGLMLSCRALGRGVEHKMLAHVGEIAEGLGKRTVHVQAIVGPRNQPALDFLRSAVGLSIAEGTAEANTVPCNAVELKRLSIDAGMTKSEPAIAISPETSKPAPPASGVVDYQRIATEFDTAAKIEQALKDRRPTGKMAARIVLHPPETETERKLAVIWCDLLGIAETGTDEDFFALGGHSLLGVQLLSRIHRELGRELPDRVIYAERLTIANLARTLELAEMGLTDHENYAAALAAVEALTDEEVEALLAQEEATQSGA